MLVNLFLFIAVGGIGCLILMGALESDRLQEVEVQE